MKAVSAYDSRLITLILITHYAFITALFLFVRHASGLVHPCQLKKQQLFFTRGLINFAFLVLQLREKIAYNTAHIKTNTALI